VAVAFFALLAFVFGLLLLDFVAAERTFGGTCGRDSAEGGAPFFATVGAFFMRAGGPSAISMHGNDKTARPTFGRGSQFVR
jgi:hypothetical protein